MQRIALAFACLTYVSQGRRVHQQLEQRLSPSSPAADGLVADGSKPSAHSNALHRQPAAKGSFHAFRRLAGLALGFNPAAALSEKKARVLIAGAGTKSTQSPGGERNVGRLLAEELVGIGADVACIVRTPAAAEELEAAGIRVAGVGDLTSLEFTKTLLSEVGPCTLFTSVGGKDDEGKRVDGVANMNLFKAALALEKQPMVVFVTSWGCGNTWDFLGEQARAFLGPALRAKTEAEDFLTSTGLRHIIVRPGGLLPSSEAATGRGIFVKGRPDVGGNIRRQDLVGMLMNLLRLKDTNGLVLTAVDQESSEPSPPIEPENLLAVSRRSNPLSRWRTKRRWNNR